jgi:hypothetical protein
MFFIALAFPNAEARDREAGIFDAERACERLGMSGNYPKMTSLLYQLSYLPGSRQL